MNLLDHIKASGGTGTASCPVIASLATAADCSAGTLYLVALGHKQAGPLLARRISDATDGAVTVNELRPDVFGEPQAAA
jgi:DNA-binding transcriptional regulator YdaS (Cro superfamily)